MKTYLNYLWCKIKNIDKFVVFLCAGFASIFIGPILLISSVTSIYNSYGYEPPGAWYIISNSLWSQVGLGLTIFGVFFLLIMMYPERDTYLSWTWAIIKSPYTISKWIFYAIQDSYYSYKVWKGWNGRCCFTCNHNEGCERTHPATITCDGYIALSTQQETKEVKT